MPAITTCTAEMYLKLGLSLTGLLISPQSPTSISIHHIHPIRKMQFCSYSFLGQNLQSLIPSPLSYIPSISKSCCFSFEIYLEPFLNHLHSYHPSPISLFISHSDCCEIQLTCLPVSILAYPQFILNTAATLSPFKCWIFSLLCSNTPKASHFT